MLLRASGHPIDLVAAPATFTIAGKKVHGEAYNGSLVGPTIQVEPGQHVNVTLRNHLAVNTNLHFHGMHVSPSGDADNPYVTIKPGTSFSYRLNIPTDQPQGTFWYHDHGMVTGDNKAMAGMPRTEDRAWGGDVESEIFAGLSGTIQVGDDRSLLPPRLRQVPAHTLVLKDIQVDHTGAIVQNLGSTSINSNAPTMRLVNGQYQPSLTMCPGQTQLWRLANEGADIFYRLHAKGYRFTVVAEDGQPAAKITQVDNLLMPPGRRYDVLVTAPTTPDTAWLETLPYSNGPQGDAYPQANLMRLKVTGKPLQPMSLPSGSMPTAPDNLTETTIAHRRVLLLGESSAGTEFNINGRQFTMDRSIFTTPAKLGTVEEWTILNTAGEAHPFHVHTDDFQVMSINGVSQPFTGWQDTIPVPSETNGKPGKVVVRIKFADFAGRIMFHCHIAAHEDHGMMSFVTVIE